MSDNVVNMFEKKKAIEEKKQDEEISDAESLEAIAKKNKENTERVAKERAAKNKGVLRSYRIKH